MLALSTISNNVQRLMTLGSRGQIFISVGGNQSINYNSHPQPHACTCPKSPYQPSGRKLGPVDKYRLEHMVRSLFEPSEQLRRANIRILNLHISGLAVSTMFSFKSPASTVQSPVESLSL